MVELVCIAEAPIKLRINKSRPSPGARLCLFSLLKKSRFSTSISDSKKMEMGSILNFYRKELIKCLLTFIRSRSQTARR
jgi:hypothetical protein